MSIADDIRQKRADLQKIAETTEWTVNGKAIEQMSKDDLAAALREMTVLLQQAAKAALELLPDERECMRIALAEACGLTLADLENDE